MDTVLQAGLSNAAVATAMAVLLLPLARLLRRPALTHALCVLILVKLVTPPVWSVPVWSLSVPPPAQPAPQVNGAAATPEFASNQPFAPIAPALVEDVGRTPLVVGFADTDDVPTTMLDPGVVENAPPPPAAPVATPTHLDVSWPALLAWVWLVGAAVCLTSVALRVRLLRRLLRFAEPAPAVVQAQARALAAGLGLSSCPEVRFVPGRLCPMLFGLLPRPRLYVSAALWRRLDAAQRQTLLLHELAHFRRADHWVRPLEVAVTVLYWWHPVVWLTRRALREPEEQCCDAWVLWGAPHAARDYAAALLAVVDFSSTSSSSSSRARRSVVPVMASGMGEFRTLKRRLTMMQQNRPAAAGRTLSRAALTALFGLAAGVLPLAPTIAQTADTPAKSEPAPAATTETTNPNEPAQATPAPGDDATRATGSTPPPATPADTAESRPADPSAATPPASKPPATPAESFDDYVRLKLTFAADHVGVIDMRRAEAEVQKAEADLAAAVAAAKHAEMRLADAKAYLQATQARSAASDGGAADRLAGESVPTTPKIDPDAAKRLETLEAEIRALREELVGIRGAAGGPGRNDRILMVYRLTNTEAREAAKHLEKLFSDVGVTATPDERTNSLIFQGNPDRIDEVRSFLEKLDSGRTETSGGGRGGDTPSRERPAQDVPAGRR